MNKINNRTDFDFNNFMLSVGLLLLMWPVFLYYTASFQHLVSISIQKFQLIYISVVYLLLFLLIKYYYTKSYFSLTTISAWVIFTSIVWFFIAHHRLVFDNSYDGIWYHQEAVLTLAKGWNPFHRLMEQSEGSQFGSFYVNHYPKAAWTAEAVIYAFTGFLQSAKAVTWIFMSGLFFVSVYAIKKLIACNWLLACVVALLIAANPIAIAQTYSFYVDGQLGITLTAMIVLLILHASTGGKAYFYLALAMFGYASNLKFTGLIYSSIIGLGYVIYLFVSKNKQLVNLLAIMSICGMFSVGFLGYPTYVTNTINAKHPFFPIMGPESFGDVIAKIPRPADFEGMNRFEKYYKGILANPVYCRAPLTTAPKQLFKPLPDKYYFTRADYEISGNGPYFAEIFYFWIPLLLAFLCLPFKHKKWYLFTALVVLLSAIINEEFWYVRYAPQLWLLYLIPVIALLSHPYLRYYSYLMVIMLLVNVMQLGYWNYSTHIAESNMNRKIMQKLAKLNRPAKVWLGWQVTFPVLAKEFNLPIQVEKVPMDTEKFGAFHGFKEGEWGMYYKADLLEAEQMEK